MKNKYIEKLRATTLATLKGEKVKIILFGSRGRQDNQITYIEQPYGKISIA